jgi:hypothetical protein
MLLVGPAVGAAWVAAIVELVVGSAVATELVGSAVFVAVGELVGLAGVSTTTTGGGVSKVVSELVIVNRLRPSSRAATSITPTTRPRTPPKITVVAVRDIL